MFTSGTDARAGPEILLLGAFTLIVDAEEVILPINAQRVLAGLCMGGRPHASPARTVLAERVWSDSRPERAQGNLRTALWRIRQADRRLIFAAQDQIRLGGSVQVDVHDCLAQAGRLLSEEPDLSPRDHQVELLAHDLLPGWDEEWLLLERERVRQIRLHALEALSARLLSAGRFGMAVQAAMAAIAAEPLRESAHQALIAAQLGEGNSAEAHRFFRQYSRLLWDELRLIPSVSFEELLARHAPRMAAAVQLNTS